MDGLGFLGHAVDGRETPAGQPVATSARTQQGDWQAADHHPQHDDEAACKIILAQGGAHQQRFTLDGYTALQEPQVHFIGKFQRTQARPGCIERWDGRFPRAGCCVVAAQGECPIGVPDIEPGHVAQPLILTVFRPVDVPPGQVAVGIAHHAAFGDLQFLIQAVIEFGGETVADQQIDGQRISQEHGAEHQREGGGETGAQGQPTPGCDHGACSWSTKPTPRRVWISGYPWPLSILRRSRAI